ncbi:PKD-like domain-containing protein [Gynurincola endophyticus]|uniref:PKD-like domain-containing protein n=1 Tax=Gynurincola endophyticus TaxID=2479004 RepID=UPI000F8E115F|nr:PKD-like domain-containing protein [Gynurincola endophyticus]
MRKLTCVLMACTIMALQGCYKNDIKELRNDVDDLKQQLKNYETLMSAINNRVYVTGYTAQTGSYTINFSDGSSIKVRNTSAFITISEDGTWIIDGVDTGKPSVGHSPEVKVGFNGHWFIDGEDTGIPAEGQNGLDAPAIVSISLVDGIMTFTFSNGESISINAAAPAVSITVPAGGFNVSKWKWLRIQPQISYADEANIAWIIGNDTISRDKNLLHVFSAPGTYDVKLVAYNAVGSNAQTVSIQVADQSYTNGVFKVYEFLPGPGQQVNKLPLWTEGETAADMALKAENTLKANGMITLGAYGGYVVMGFDHVIMNNADKRDFLIKGNAGTNNAEPGIIMVSYDANGNGLPDDEWYEIAGSEYNNPATIHNYEITYHKPDPLNGDVRWTDNQGGEGFVLRNTFNTQASYYPLWHEANTLTFKGTLLPKTATNTATPPAQYWVLPAYGWGYADNHANTHADAKIDLNWAVDKNGNSVKLKGIDFIKVYTGLNQDAGWLGETSTEVTGVEIYN